MGGLIVDLEGCVVIEGIHIQPRIHDPQCNTNAYAEEPIRNHRTSDG